MSQRPSLTLARRAFVALFLASGLAACVPEELVPAPTPADDRRIAVLTLTVTSTAEGAVETVQMEAGEIRPGFSPNVLGLSGAWSVLLATENEEVVGFGTFDPRRVEVEGLEGEDPFRYIVEPRITWDLVVPLHGADGQDLRVRAVGLLDETGRLIFAAAIAEDEIRPTELPPGRLQRFPAQFLTTLQ